MAPDGSSGSQEQEASPQRCDEVDGDNEVVTKAGSGRTCDVATCGLLEGTLGAGQVDLRSRNLWSLGRYARGTSGTESSHLGMEHPGAAGSGEVETCRGGDVVEN